MVLWDMSHFYDSIDLVQLSEMCLARDFDPLDLLLSLQVYMGPRLLRANGQHSDLLAPSEDEVYMSVVPGCGRAVAFARRFLHGLLWAQMAETTNFAKVMGAPQ